MISRTEVLGLALGEVTAEMTVHVWEPKGSQRSILCLHDFTGNGQDFAPLAETLVRSGITVIAPDLIGRGKSSFLGDDRAYSAQAYMTCITVANQLQKPQAGHLACAWGGLLLTAWLWATGWRTKGLALVDVPLHPSAEVLARRKTLRRDVVAKFDSRDQALAHVDQDMRLEGYDPALRRRLTESRIMAVDDRWRLAIDPATASDFGLDVDFALDRQLASASVPVLLAYSAQSPHVADPALAGLLAHNPRLQMVDGLGDQGPAKLAKLEQKLMIGGWFGQCLTP
jgi:pimeloyl-ACP methyl ester carboxylesterase